MKWRNFITLVVAVVVVKTEDGNYLLLNGKKSGPSSL